MPEPLDKKPSMTACNFRAASTCGFLDRERCAHHRTAPAVEPEPVDVSRYCPACEIEIGGPCKDCYAPAQEPEHCPKNGTPKNEGEPEQPTQLPPHGPHLPLSDAPQQPLMGNAGAKALSDTTTKITRYFARHADGTEAEVTADIKALSESLRAVTERITSMPLPYVHDESDIGDLGA